MTQYHIRAYAVRSHRFSTFTKTFNLVNLIYKLEKIGIFGNIFNWFKSHLNHHYRQVNVNGHSSSKSIVSSGVLPSILIRL